MNILSFNIFYSSFSISLKHRKKRHIKAPVPEPTRIDIAGYVKDHPASYLLGMGSPPGLEEVARAGIGTPLL